MSNIHRIDNTSYREWGTSEKIIVMLHGWPAESSHYLKLGKELKQKGYRVIIPDLPGWGNTPEPKTPWNVSDYQNWFDDFIDKMNIKRFVLFGHSFGGRIAIKTAIKHPYKIDKLILCSSAGIKPNPLTAKRKFIKIIALIGKIIMKLPLIKALANPAKKLLYRYAGSYDYLNTKGVMRETIKKVLAEDLQPLLRNIKLPTLILWGSDDGATPLKDGELMHELISNSDMIIYTNEKHNLPKLIPEKLANDIHIYIQKKNIVSEL